jgi:hypothetical protein
MMILTNGALLLVGTVIYNDPFSADRFEEADERHVKPYTHQHVAGRQTSLPAARGPYFDID